MIEFNSIAPYFGWLTSLSKSSIVMFFSFLTIIAGMSAYIWFRETNTSDIAEVKEIVIEVRQKVSVLESQTNATRLADQNNWARQFQHNDSVSQILKKHDGYFADIALITAANSPSLVFKYLYPYLSGIKEDTYHTILWIQKMEILQRIDSTKFKIEVRNLKH